MPKLQSRPFQQQARALVNADLNHGRSTVFLSPCGTGKTKTACMVISDQVNLGKTIYILCPQIEIYRQWLKDLISFGLNPGTISDKGVQGQSRQVYLCMTLSLVNIMPLLPKSIQPDIVVTDEAQHSMASSWESIYEGFSNAVRLGLTATLHHGSGEPFIKWYDNIICTIAKSEAIRLGYITPPMPIIAEQFKQHIPQNGDDFDTEIQAELLGEPQIIGNIIDTYEQVFGGLQVIVPCCTYKHAKETTAAFNQAGWIFKHLHSNLAPFERKKILDEIAAGKINGVCTVGIGIEGLSIDGLYGVMWLRLTKSPIIWTQFNGRAERCLAGKKYYACVDFVGNMVIHGRPDRDLEWDLTTGELISDADDGAIKSRMCPYCGVANNIENVICCFCGGDMDNVPPGEKKGRKLPKMIDGDMVLVDDQSVDQMTEYIQVEKLKIKEAIKEEEAGAIAEDALKGYDKIEVLRKGMFNTNHGRQLLKETLAGYKE